MNAVAVFSLAAVVAAAYLLLVVFAMSLGRTASRVTALEKKWAETNRDAKWTHSTTPTFDELRGSGRPDDLCALLDAIERGE